MSTASQTDYQRFSLQLAHYVNGTLDATERAWMDAYIAKNPSKQQELRFTQVLQATTQNTVSNVPEQERIARLLNDWNRHPPKSHPLSFLSWQRWKNWLGGQISIPTPAFIFAGAIVLIQAALIGTLLTRHSPVIEQAAPEIYRGGGQSAPRVLPTIKAKFKPNTTYSDVLILLQRAELSIQGGPSEIGEIWLNIPNEKTAEDICQKLKDSGLLAYCQ